MPETEKIFSDGIVMVPSTTNTDLNRFVAYAQMGFWCKMVLFEIVREPTSNVCSYQILAAKYYPTTCGSDPYCTFLSSGNCNVLAGEANADGYGIEELFFDYKTSATNSQTSQCSGAVDSCASYLGGDNSYITLNTSSPSTTAKGIKVTYTKENYTGSVDIKLGGSTGTTLAQFSPAGTPCL